MKEDKKAGPRSFARFIENAGDGDFHRDISEELQTVLDDLQSQSSQLGTKIKGKITITLGLSCDPRGIVGIDVDCASKRPRIKRATAQAWVDKNNNVVFQDPRQQRLPLVEVTRAERVADFEPETANAREV